MKLFFFYFLKKLKNESYNSDMPFYKMEYEYISQPQINFKNFSIYLHKNTLFGYMEYHGDNLERDNKLMAENTKVQEWWSLCGPCQVPDPNRKKGEWWSIMEEVFHHD